MAEMTLEEAFAAATVDVPAGMVDDVLVIDAPNRKIIVPDSETAFGVETDRNVERKYFRCPRIVGDNIDLYTHKIYVVYIFSKDARGTFQPEIVNGTYWCDDVAVDGDCITFSWVLSDNVLSKSGIIAFKILAATTENGLEKTRWNTVPAYGTVQMTVPDGDDISERYPDIVTQLLERMDAVEDIATPEAMQGYVNTYLAEHPVVAGATEEQAAQIDQNTQGISALKGEIANLSGGLNSTAKSLLITILRDGIYNTNQSANITALSVALENTGGDNTSIPTESISIAGDTTVNFGESLILTATLTPSNTTDSVVWASSDETIATVTGSGSKKTIGTVTGIKGGTVTIRAIAGSISTTYTVTVVENVSLPDGYTALDYIVSNWKSSFDTGITADENTSAEYKISFIQLGAVHVLADNGAYAFPASLNGGSVRSKRGGTDYKYNYVFSTDTIYTIKAFAENSVNVNGTNIDTKSVVGNTPSGNGTLIFNNYGSVNSPYGSTAKFYYMKIWEGETLVRWYVPCKDINGTVGMYDVVGNTFNTKTVTGESFTEV